MERLRQRADFLAAASGIKDRLAFWRGVTRALDGSKTNGLTVGVSPFEARVGDGAFAFELTYRRAGKPLLYIGEPSLHFV